ncbi:MAG: prolipoprotein diacylglyceryl transferase [Anaerolineales bacterium]|nr:prolipoprotein diacylglyceryl transferase [Anaerolineales bacterium]MCB9004793.1 prolipoprotein diacylglyceryl transferase [Ardenticatenaceae bacterium]
MSRRPLYWYLITFFLLVAAALLVAHWVTGQTPGRAAIHIAALNFDIYWYGIWIVGGIALGAYVVSELAGERATAVFNQHISPSTQQISLSELDLPDEIRGILRKQKLHTVGDVLFRWGLDVRYLGLNAAGQDKLHEALIPLLAEDMALLDDAPWRVWNPDHVWNGMIMVMILAVIGARLYHVLTPSPSMAAVGINSPLDYFRNPAKLLDFRSGGLGIYGGIAGGALGLWLYTRRQHISMLAWADMAVIGLALGQVFGRWGNYFNQELYGRPTNIPWAITIDPLYRLPDYAEFSHFHPAFLYESLWNLLTFFVLYTLLRRYSARLLRGDLMALYLIFYAIGRTLLETVRLDSRTVTLGSLELNMAVATLVSLLIAAAMLFWILVRHLRLRAHEGD